MPRYIISTIEQVEREYVVEANSEAEAFDLMVHPRFIRVGAPPYAKTRRKAQIKPNG